MMTAHFGDDIGAQGVPSRKGACRATLKLTPLATLRLIPSLYA